MGPPVAPEGSRPLSRANASTVLNNSCTVGSVCCQLKQIDAQMECKLSAMQISELVGRSLNLLAASFSLDTHVEEHKKRRPFSGETPGGSPRAAKRAARELERVA